MKSIGQDSGPEVGEGDQAEQQAEHETDGDAQAAAERPAISFPLRFRRQRRRWHNRFLRIFVSRVLIGRRYFFRQV